jgi:hypothetical protein
MEEGTSKIFSAKNILWKKGKKDVKKVFEFAWFGGCRRQEAILFV